MKNFLLLTVGFVIGVATVWGYSFLKIEQSKPTTASEKPVITVAPTFSVLTPPSESLIGEITSVSGNILWQSRVATQPAELSGNRKIHQGEGLITEKNSEATVNFSQICTINISEESDLYFARTLPQDLVVNQKKGKIRYQINGGTPLSIRIRNALITKTSGIIEVTVTDEESIILISTIKGTAKIGFNDKDYVSQTFTLREGQIYEYNSDERTAINQKNK